MSFAPGSKGQVGAQSKRLKASVRAQSLLPPKPKSLQVIEFEELSAPQSL